VAKDLKTRGSKIMNRIGRPNYWACA